MRIEHEDLVRGTNRSAVMVSCVECGSTTFHTDYNEASRICCGCGMVDSDFAVFVPDFSNYANTNSVFRRGAAYRRRYHFNERVAQLMCTGPKAPLFVLHKVVLECRRKKITRPKRIDAQFIKRCCSQIGADKFAERWIWIRREALRMLRIHERHELPTDFELSEITRDFQSASIAFDAVLYRTRSGGPPRDRDGRPISGLARHNFPNYNFVWHCLLMRRGRGTRARVGAHFFFPLLRTTQVMNTIYGMWKLICEYNKWECPRLYDILDRKYRND